MYLSRENFKVTQKTRQRQWDGGWEVSQAAACDGNFYQIPQEQAEINPPPGALPI